MIRLASLVVIAAVTCVVLADSKQEVAAQAPFPNYRVIQAEHQYQQTILFEEQTGRTWILFAGESPAIWYPVQRLDDSKSVKLFSLTDAKRRLQEVQEFIQVLKKDFGEDHPMIKQKIEKMKMIEAEIQDELEALGQ